MKQILTIAPCRGSASEVDRSAKDPPSEWDAEFLTLVEWENCPHLALPAASGAGCPRVLLSRAPHRPQCSLAGGLDSSA